MVKNFKKTCLNKNCIQANKKEIRKQTCLERYGVENVAQLNKVKEKIKQTCLEKYGVENAAQSNKVKEKIKQTCLEKYGVNYYVQSDKHINLFKQNWNKIKEKIYNTKKKNNSFTRSNPEDTCYLLLKEIWPNTIRQYNSILYPFNCDFFIPEIDTYIEYQGFWTHGKKPFEGTLNDLKIVDEWKRKNTGFYDGAIKNWTIIDVNKCNIAKNNKLNWLEFFSIDSFKEWLQNYQNKYAKTR